MALKILEAISDGPEAPADHTLVSSLNFDKEYLFGFETLVFAASRILFMHNHVCKS